MFLMYLLNICVLMCYAYIAILESRIAKLSLVSCNPEGLGADFVTCIAKLSLQIFTPAPGGPTKKSF